MTAGMIASRDAVRAAYARSLALAGELGEADDAVRRAHDDAISATASAMGLANEAVREAVESVEPEGMTA